MEQIWQNIQLIVESRWYTDGHCFILQLFSMFEITQYKCLGCRRRGMNFRRAKEGLRKKI